MVDQNGTPISGRNNLYNFGFNGSFGCPDCDGAASRLIVYNKGKFSR